MFTFFIHLNNTHHKLLIHPFLTPNEYTNVITHLDFFPLPSEISTLTIKLMKQHGRVAHQNLMFN